MKPIHVIFFLCVFVISACNKKKKDPEEVPPEIIAPPDTGLKCGDLPEPAFPFDWQDTTRDPNKNVSAFIFNPANPNEIILKVLGDISGRNRILVYNVVTQQALQVGLGGPYLPHVNQKGWIVFSDADNNVVLVKSNGEGLKFLTGNKRAHSPKWDFSGDYIYYFTEPYVNVPAQLVKIDMNGTPVNAFPMELPYFGAFKKSDRIIYTKPQDNTCSLILKDLAPPYTETKLISGPTYIKPGQINFENICLDKNDENFFWSNSIGIFKCHIATLKVDTIFKNCENFIYNNPMISFTNNELTYSHEILKPLNSLRLLHIFKAMELNLNTYQTSEVNIFP